ncbi:ras-related protein Rab-2-A-like [Triticum dicoccoides]|uniref:ras-related protein Rab-2-A-like n=1 Tax=Triticum dicoccoides TaxID=85692 RepID=UPI00188EA97B|nr:ras-related protein Rab-2-A-like [Triticum dicoccoides]
MQSARRFTYTIVGDAGVGKTCLERQFTSRTFQEVHDLTIGVEFSTRTINVDDKRIKLDICDTAGHEAFVPITKQFYCGAACIILVYDITRRETFDHIAILLERARELSRAGVTLALIGNKCDLSHMRAVSYEEGREFAKRHDLVFMETSAKTTQNVDEAFILAAERIYKKVQVGVLDLPEKSLETSKSLASLGVVKSRHANMLDSQFLAQNGSMEVDMKLRNPNDRFMHKDPFELANLVPSLATLARSRGVSPPLNIGFQCIKFTNESDNEFVGCLWALKDGLMDGLPSCMPNCPKGDSSEDEVLM